MPGNILFLVSGLDIVKVEAAASVAASGGTARRLGAIVPTSIF